MGVVAQGAPVFRIGGDPGGISTRASVMMDRANEFADIHAGLSSLTSDGWQGRTADHFRYKFNLQIKGWLDAQIAFSDASMAYQSYASTLLSAQSQCDEIRSRWEQGRNAVEQAQNNKADARSRAAAEGGTPMFDASCDEGPGRSTMAAAEDDFQTLVNQVNESGTLLVNALNSGISKLPERTWMDAVTRTLKSVYDGLVEATIDLIKLTWTLGGYAALYDFGRFICGYMTFDELHAKWGELPAETFVGLTTALSEKPEAFFEGLAKGLFDYDTLIDDPGRAFGHAIPDILITIATAGAGTGASAGSKGATGASRAARIGRAVFKELTHISDIEDIAHLGKLAFRKIKRVGVHAVTSLSDIAKNAAERLHDLSHAANGMTGALDGAADAGRAARTGGTIGDTSHAAHAAGGATDAAGSTSHAGHTGGNTADAAGNTSHASHGAADVKDSDLPPTDPGHRSNGVSSAAQPAATPHASAAGDASTGGHAAPANTAPGTPNGAHNNAFMNADTGGTTHGAGGTANGAPSGNDFAPQPDSAVGGKPPQRPDVSFEKMHFSKEFDNVHAGDPGASDLLRSPRDEAAFVGRTDPVHANGQTRGADDLVGAGVGRSEASVGAQGSYERAGAFGGSDPSRASHGADGFGGTADFGANAGHAGHGAHGVSNSADVGGGVSDASRGTHAAGAPTGQGGGHVGADTGTHGGSSAPAQGPHRADPGMSTGDTHGASRADSTPGHGDTPRAGHGGDGTPDAPTTPKKETPAGDTLGGDKQPHGGKHAADSPATHADEAADARKAGHGSGDASGSGKADADAQHGHDSGEHADAEPKAKDHSANGKANDAAESARHGDKTEADKPGPDAPEKLPYNEIVEDLRGEPTRPAKTTPEDPQTVDDYAKVLDNNYEANRAATAAPDALEKSPNDDMIEDLSGDTQPHGGKHAADTPATHADEAADTTKAGHGSGDANGSGKVDADAKQGHDSVERADADPTTKDHSANGKADDATDSARHGDKTEADKPTSDKSHKEDDAAHHDGDEHPKNSDDKHSAKNDDADTKSTKDEADAYKSDEDSAERADADPTTKDHSANGKADDAADSAHHGDKTEADKPTSDKSTKEDDAAHHDGDEHPKNSDDKHSAKNDDADTKSTKDEADTHKSTKDSDAKSDKDSGEHADDDPKAKDHSANGKADDAADLTRHGDKTEADKPTSDKSHKEDDAAHHDGDEHPKDTDDKHTDKTDDADTKSTNDEAEDKSTKDEADDNSNKDGADTHESDKDEADTHKSDKDAEDGAGTVQDETDSSAEAVEDQPQINPESLAVFPKDYPTLDYIDSAPLNMRPIDEIPELLEHPERIEPPTTIEELVERSPHRRPEPEWDNHELKDVGLGKQYKTAADITHDPLGQLSHGTHPEMKSTADWTRSRYYDPESGYAVWRTDVDYGAVPGTKKAYTDIKALTKDFRIDGIDRTSHVGGSFMAPIIDNVIIPNEYRGTPITSIHEPYRQYAFNVDVLPDGYKAEISIAASEQGSLGGTPQLQILERSVNGKWKPLNIAQLLEKGFIKGVTDHVGTPQIPDFEAIKRLFDQNK